MLPLDRSIHIIAMDPPVKPEDDDSGYEKP